MTINPNHNHNHNPTFAPASESFLEPPRFQYTPSIKEQDFAQLIACGGDPAESVLASQLVPMDQAEVLGRAHLYRIAANLLKSEAVQERITYFAYLHRNSMSVTADRVRQEAAAIAFADFALAYHKDLIIDPDTDTITLPGAPITNPHDIPRHLRAAIKEWKVDKDGVVHIKYHDKVQALKMVGDMEGLFDEAYRAQAPQVTVTLGSSPAAGSPPSTCPQASLSLPPPAGPEPVPTLPLPEFLI